MLTVKTDKGEFILDNQDEEILLWSETELPLREAAVADRSELWVSLGDPRPAARHRDVALNDAEANQRSYATPVTSPPLPVPRPGSRAAGSPPEPAAPFLGRRAR